VGWRTCDRDKKKEAVWLGQKDRLVALATRKMGKEREKGTELPWAEKTHPPLSRRKRRGRIGRLT